MKEAKAGDEWFLWVKEQGMIEDLFELAARAPLLANVAVTMALGASTFWLWADELLWHDSDAYKKGEIRTGQTNWWKLAHKIEHYGVMGIITTVFVFQVLSDASIAVPIFLLVWEYGMGLALPLVEMVATYMLYWGYDDAYSKKNDSTYTATEQSNASSTMAGIWEELTEHKAAHVLFEMVLWTNYSDHFLGQWLMSTPEAQDKWIEKLEKKAHHIAEAFGDEHHEKDGHEKGDEKHEKGEHGEEGPKGEEGAPEGERPPPREGGDEERRPRPEE